MDAKTSLIQPTFLFDDCQRFTAQCEHDRLRSSLESNLDLPSTADPWKQRPVDFTMKNFHPNRKKTRKASLASIDEISPREKLVLNARRYDPTVMRPFAVGYQHTTNKSLADDDDNDDEENNFLVERRIQYEKVKRMLNTEQYKNPQPHDFRQYPNIKELGLSEFQTAYNRDPNNIRFLSDHLNTLWLQEREDERVPNLDKPLPEMYRVLTAKRNWEPRLVLPKLVFPNKYAAYTRYRNPTRTVKSAYWERVEDHFDYRQKTRLHVT